MLPLLAAGAVGKWAKEIFVNKWTIGGAIILAIACVCYLKGCQDERSKWLLKEAEETKQQIKDIGESEVEQEKVEVAHDKRVRKALSGPLSATDAAGMLNNWPDQAPASYPARPSASEGR
jgi:hypothetical protein